MSGLQLSHFAFAIPVLLMLLYMWIDKDLSATAVILLVCLSFTSLMMYFLYSIEKAKQDDIKVEDAKDGIDRSMFKVFIYIHMYM